MARAQEQRETALAKTLCYVLGVAPGEFFLAPDYEGWVAMKELIKALHEDEAWRGVREGMIRDVAERVAPEDIEIVEGRIRCRSRRPPAPDYATQPPAHLYTAVRRRGWPTIRQRGLEGGPAGPILCAADEESALIIGRRRDPEPVLVTVQAHFAMEQGVVFGVLSDRLWICDWVPADCLMGPSVPEGQPVAKKKTKKPKEPSVDPWAQKMPPPEAMPGSYLVDPDDFEKPYKRKGLKKEVDWKNQRRKDSRRGKGDDW